MRPQTEVPSDTLHHLDQLAPALARITRLSFLNDLKNNAQFVVAPITDIPDNDRKKHMVFFDTITGVFIFLELENRSMSSETHVWRVNVENSRNPGPKEAARFLSTVKQENDVPKDLLIKLSHTVHTLISDNRARLNRENSEQREAEDILRTVDGL